MTVVACIGIILAVFAAKTNGMQRMNIFMVGLAATIGACILSVFTGSLGQVLLWSIITLVVANIVFSLIFRNVIPPPLYERQLTAKDLTKKTLYYRYSGWRGRRWRKRMIKKFGKDPFAN